MNLWITKLSGTGFSDTDRSNFSQIISDKFSQPFDEYEHKTADIHFISFSKNQTSDKRYIHSKNSDELFSYSGIVVDTHESTSDYRNAEALANKSLDFDDLANQLCGQFALISIKNKEFRCVVDNLGVYKVFYYFDEQNNIYVSNHLAFIQSVKNSERNYDFLINFIANGGTFGYETIEKNVRTLAESGEFRWTKKGGHLLKSYQDFSDFFSYSFNGEPIESIAKKYQNISSNLLKFHDILIPLSGGFDSRTILNMFWSNPKNNLTAYTYPDHPYDLSLAKKVTRKYGINHITLKPANIPSISELHDFTIKREPFLCYSSVFKFLFYEESQKKLFSSNKVVLLGNGGDTDLGIYKFGNLKNKQSQTAVEKLAKKLINRTVLTEYGYEKSYRNFTDHYMQKYASLYDTVENFNLSTAHFIFERFASYQGQKVSESYTLDTNTNYLPFADKDFIKLIFSSDSDQLIRRKKGSIHHKLSDYLKKGNAPHISYSSALHWNATKSDKAKYYLKRDYIDPLLKKLNLTMDKYSNQVRNSFFDENERHFMDVVHSYPNSSLWKYIDYEHVKSSLENPKNRKKNMKLLFRILPLLKEGI